MGIHRGGGEETLDLGMDRAREASWADELGDLLRAVADSDVELLDVEHDGARVVIRREPTAGGGDGASVEAAGTERAPSSFTITSPLVGVFRRAASGDGDGRVEEGDHVSAGQTVGAVEAMRMLNRVQSERAGLVERVLVQDGQAVEYGQPLLVLRAMP